MAKKINPKDQTKAIRDAKWAFLQLDDKRKAAFFEAEPELVRLRDKPIGLSMSDWDEIFKGLLCAPAVKEAFITSEWTAREIRRKTAGKDCDYQEMNLEWKEEILKDAPTILDSLIPTDLPAETMIVSIDLTRPTDVIMAEFGEILSRNKAALKKIQPKQHREKWLPLTPDLLEVYGLWEGYEQRRCFVLIAKKLKISESTVKSRWRLAYKLITGKDYTREQATEDAIELCGECKDKRECYKVIEGNMEFLPCVAYLKLAGKNTPRERTHANFDQMADGHVFDSYHEPQEDDAYNED